jgi:DNA-binding GntR family transcriptional regulator
MPSSDISSPEYGFLSRLQLPARGSTTEHVQTILRDAIVASELPPGSVINKHVICERLGVSRFPVSEALGRLQSEGLVEILPQRGTRVTRIRLSDVRESMFIRSSLEAGTVREVAGRITPNLIAALDRNLRYQRSAVEVDDRRGFHALDLEFHDILIDALNYPRAKLMIESARASLDRVRRILQSPRRHAVTLEEHLRIFDAIQVGDGEAAGRAMMSHLGKVIEELTDFATDNPDIFDDMG